MDADGLAQLRDRIAVQELSARYNRAFDDVDVETWLNTFTDDGEMSLNGREWSGHDALRRLITRVGFGMVHMTTDAVVSVEGDRAVQQCSLLLLRRQRDRGSISLVTSGRYADTLVRTASGWRFRRRAVVTDVAI